MGPGHFSSSSSGTLMALQPHRPPASGPLHRSLLCPPRTLSFQMFMTLSGRLLRGHLLREGSLHVLCRCPALFFLGRLSPRDVDAADGFPLDSKWHEDYALCLGASPASCRHLAHRASAALAEGTLGYVEGTHTARPLDPDDRCLQNVLVSDWLPGRCPFRWGFSW